MKRLHVHVAVKDIAQSVDFYSTLFAAEPTVTKLDYAKWMLDDPRVNFAISTHAGRTGVDHLGVQVETVSELNEVNDRLKLADRSVLEEGATTCCYAKSESRGSLILKVCCGKLFLHPARAPFIAQRPRRETHIALCKWKMLGHLLVVAEHRASFLFY